MARRYRRLDAAASGEQSMPDQVTDNRAEHEFELEVDGHRAIAAYQLEGDTIVFTHTLVPKKLEGRGVGSRLIRGALDAARDRGLNVIPQCPFVKAYIERHSEYRDLLA
jgi:predicted GNAT family acetyltransferase